MLLLSQAVNGLTPTNGTALVWFRVSARQKAIHEITRTPEQNHFGFVYFVDRFISKHRNLSK
jgi:hypothetical protein